MKQLVNGKSSFNHAVSNTLSIFLLCMQFIIMAEEEVSNE